MPIPPIVEKTRGIMTHSYIHNQDTGLIIASCQHYRAKDPYIKKSTQMVTQEPTSACVYQRYGHLAC